MRYRNPLFYLFDSLAGVFSYVSKYFFEIFVLTFAAGIWGLPLIIPEIATWYKLLCLGISIFVAVSYYYWRFPDLDELDADERKSAYAMVLVVGTITMWAVFVGLAFGMHVVFS